MIFAAAVIFDQAKCPIKSWAEMGMGDDVRPAVYAR